mmetsp:Transcript_23990/g.55962  ORF Transcript_23990/g.55962 Transcript_23990/m.55962 type:complete len:88 (-) Transcript_23990:560-823(-)|eukprot:CAMPEP_0116824510 /NCGR_PEP_ID=MMETSP0418-20121206/1440_1 /TAXON_ID=1158023 /ORGANISM="Astrosyne radiata, Strain 13vi08-1A" /LENGTH=87 /DNA_ID=CAMNT_0004452895 /DNA_START=809 /DNA_END=1072 /DNA_ORIENTATION=-
METLDVPMVTTPVPSSLPVFPRVSRKDQRTVALEEWVKNANIVRQEFLAQIETVTVRVNKHYGRKRNMLEEDKKHVEDSYKKRLWRL